MATKDGSNELVTDNAGSEILATKNENNEATTVTIKTVAQKVKIDERDETTVTISRVVTHTVSRRLCHSGTSGQLSPLKFHEVHGKLIEISPDRSVASRKWSEESDSGAVFSNRPVRINEKVYLRVVTSSKNATIRLGFVTDNPTTLSDERLRDGSGFSAYSYILIDTDLIEDNIYCINMNSAGKIQYLVNGNQYLTSEINPVSHVWAYVNIEGNGSIVELCSNAAEESYNVKKANQMSCDTSTVSDTLKSCVTKPSAGLKTSDKVTATPINLKREVTDTESIDSEILNAIVVVSNEGQALHTAQSMHMALSSTENTEDERESTWAADRVNSTTTLTDDEIENSASSTADMAFSFTESTDDEHDSARVADGAYGTSTTTKDEADDTANGTANIARDFTESTDDERDNIRTADRDHDTASTIDDEIEDTASSTADIACDSTVITDDEFTTATTVLDATSTIDDEAEENICRIVNLTTATSNRDEVDSLNSSSRDFTTGHDNDAPTDIDNNDEAAHNSAQDITANATDAATRTTESRTPYTDELLKFHKQFHGKHIEISADGTQAKRKSQDDDAYSFDCKAFSSRPVRTGEKVCLRVVRAVSNLDHDYVWLCFSTRNPSNIINSPGLCKHTRYRTFDSRLFKKGNILSYHFDSAGHVHYTVNGENIDSCLWAMDVTSPIWAYIEMRRNGCILEFCDSNIPTGPADEAAIASENTSASRTADMVPDSTTSTVDELDTTRIAERAHGFITTTDDDVEDNASRTANIAPDSTTDTARTTDTTDSAHGSTITTDDKAANNASRAADMASESTASTVEELDTARAADTSHCTTTTTEEEVEDNASRTVNLASGSRANTVDEQDTAKTANRLPTTTTDNSANNTARRTTHLAGNSTTNDLNAPTRAFTSATPIYYKPTYTLRPEFEDYYPIRYDARLYDDIDDDAVICRFDPGYYLRSRNTCDESPTPSTSTRTSNNTSNHSYNLRSRNVPRDVSPPPTTRDRNLTSNNTSNHSYNLRSRNVPRDVSPPPTTRTRNATSNNTSNHTYNLRSRIIPRDVSPPPTTRTRNSTSNNQSHYNLRPRNSTSSSSTTRSNRSSEQSDGYYVTRSGRVSRPPKRYGY